MLKNLTTSLIFLLSYSTSFAQEDPISTKITHYKDQINQLENFRLNQLSQYKIASTKEKKKLITQVRTKLEKTLTENIFPAWYGTPWDFNGTSNRPGEGKIACGYFVSTTLKHIGFNINRFKLAQQPSQRIISTFVNKDSMDISSRRSLAHVKRKLITSGDGIYIVGLDTHVGYLVVKDTRITFIHSSYYRPHRKVVAEPYDTKNPLSDSKYRVVGKLFHDQMVSNWLNAKPYKIAQ